MKSLGCRLATAACLGAVTVALATAHARPKSHRLVRSPVCYSEIAVAAWTPKQGPPARWIADHIAQVGCHSLTVLGTTAQGLWTIEGAVGDASGECDELDLVFTHRSGARTKHSLLGASAAPQPDPDRREVMSRLRELAQKKVWDPGKLQRPRKLIYSPFHWDDPQPFYPGYVLRVEDPAHDRGYELRLSEERVMCWCFIQWDARVTKSR